MFSEFCSTGVNLIQFVRCRNKLGIIHGLSYLREHCAIIFFHPQEAIIMYMRMLCFIFIFSTVCITPCSSIVVYQNIPFNFSVNVIFIHDKFY